MPARSFEHKVRVSVRVFCMGLMLCATGFAPAALAQTDVWLGGTGNWSDASKWSAGVPTSTSNVFIDNGNGTASVVTVNGGFQCNNLTIDTDDALMIPGGGNLSVFGTSIANAGKIVLDDTNGVAQLGIGGNVMLTGGGTVTMNDTTGAVAAVLTGVPGTILTNVNNKIQGSGQIGGQFTLVNQTGGVVNANQSGRGLWIVTYAGVTNQGLMEATGGGALNLAQNISANNSGGTISSIGTGSVVLLINITQGGTLTTSGGGLIQGEGTLDGSTHGTLNNQGTFQVPGGHSTVLMGIINNTGTFVLDDTNGDSSLGVPNGQNVTLAGGGTVSMNDTTGAVAAFISGGASSMLTNVNNKIQGSGQIGQAGGLALVNQKKGVINANQAHPLYLDAPAGTTNQGLIEATAGRTVFITTLFSNAGTLSVAKNSLIQITNTFSNFAGTTLTGGTYNVTGKLQFPGANIATNAAHISLTGAASAITDLSNIDALRSLANTTSVGALSLSSGRNLTTPGGYSNAGALTVGSGAKFNTPSSYTQTAGTTTVDGTLTAPSGTSIQAGKVFGKGTIASTVVSSGSVTAGDSLTKAGKLSPSTYTQNATGSLNVQIGGLALGTQYSQLTVANGVSLRGTLNIKLINSFVPAIGDTFTIMTGSAISKTFTMVNGLGINSGEHFQINYGAANVTLTVESGP